MNGRKQVLCAATLMLTWLSPLQAGDGEGRSSYPGDFGGGKVPEELELHLPAFPGTSGLREIYVSAVASNVVLVDAATLTVGVDRIVRYVLVVQAPGGARNVSYEGMNCEDRKWRLYATGRTDGSWSPVRNGAWREIENKPVNRHHAALSRHYFCPNGGVILDADEGRRALKLGQHPDAS